MISHKDSLVERDFHDSPSKDSPNKLRLKMISNTDKKMKDSITTTNEKENKYEMAMVRSHAY